MKALLVFLVIAAVSAHELTLNDGPTPENFIKGFLSGIGERKSPDDLIKCLHKVEEVIAKIHAALELILSFEIQNIIKGVTQLIAAVKELNEVVKPCSEGYETLRQLFYAIANAEIHKIVQIIIQKSMTLMFYLIAGINCYKDGQYECLGKNLGAILKEIFLAKIDIEGSDGMAFLKGFVEGLGGHFDENQFKNCVKDFQHLFEAIKKAFEAIKTKKLDKIIEGVIILIGAVRTLVDDLKICAKDVEIIKKLINALSNIDVRKIATKLLLHIGQVIGIITKTAPCFASKNYYCIGHGFGSMIKLALF